MNKAIFIILIISHLAKGQDVIVHAQGENPIEVSFEFSLVAPPNLNQYIAKQWANGKLFYTNGTSKYYDSLNFDRCSNELEVVVNNKALSILPMGLSGALVYNSTSSGTMLLVGKVADKARFLLIESTGQFLLASYLISSEKKKM